MRFRLHKKGKKAFANRILWLMLFVCLLVVLGAVGLWFVRSLDSNVHKLW